MDKKYTIVFSRLNLLFFKIIGKTRPLFGYYSSFLNTMTNIAQNGTINWISIDGVHGIQNEDCRMVGADESTVLWQPPNELNFNITRICKNTIYWHEVISRYSTNNEKKYSDLARIIFEQIDKAISSGFENCKSYTLISGNFWTFSYSLFA